MTDQSLDGFLAACKAGLGPGAILRDAADTSPHLVDFWGYVEGAAAAVLRPQTTAEVATIVRHAARHGVALVPQGGNTGLVGGNIPDKSGRQVVLSLGRLDRIRAVDAAGAVLVAEAGCTLAAIQETAAGAGRLFPLSLGSEGTCQIGGNLATNAGGVNVLRYGMARDLVLGLEVVLADGRVWDGLRTLRKDNTGYDLKQLFIGGEGSLGIITAASLRLFAPATERATLFLAVASPEAALDVLARTRERFGELVTSFELMAAICVDAACEHLPGVRFPLGSRSPWYVLTELAWSLPEGLLDRADAFVIELADAGLAADGTRAQSESQRAMLWQIRDGISEGLRHQGKIARNDIAVPISAVPALLERGRALLDEAFPATTLAAFGHLGDGNLHFNVLLPAATADLAAQRDAIQHAVFDLVQELGGSISAEHGIGRLKRAELHARKDPLELELMARLKEALDPAGILNPGVIV